MEIDAAASRLLFAYAAELLFGWEGLRVADQPNVQRRMQQARQRRRDLRNNWDINFSEGIRIQGVYR